MDNAIAAGWLRLRRTRDQIELCVLQKKRRLKRLNYLIIVSDLNLCVWDININTKIVYGLCGGGEMCVVFMNGRMIYMEFRSYLASNC